MTKRNIRHRQSRIVQYALCFASMMICSCSLDENPRDQIPEEEVYTTGTALFHNTVATLYNYIGGYGEGQGLQGTIRGVYDLQTFGSDEALLPTRGGDWYDGGLWQDMYRHSWSAGHELPKNAWLYLYKVITLCNRSLELLEAHKSLISEAELLDYQSEVRALRAIYYWYLMDLFGSVPIITTTEASIQDVTQTPRPKVFQFVVDELNASLVNLEYENSTHTGNYYGRVTYPVAIFALAKLMLNAEVYSGTPQWQRAIDYCDLLENMGFQLESKYENNFIINNENSTENIWTIPMDKHLFSNQQQNMYRSYHYRHAAAYGFIGENGTCATKRVLEVFGYNTGELDERFHMNYWSGHVYDLKYQDVLDRMGEPLVYYPSEVAMDLSGSKYVETAGARMKKYEVDPNATKDGKLMDNDIVLFRYADVLLMRAEAKFRIGGAGYMGEEGISSAQDDFDAVRQRAGVRWRPITLQNLLDERLLELCWEGWRRQDLIRFGQYKSLYEGEGSAPMVDESDGHPRLFPIPADIIALNHNLVQNPGY